MRRGGSLAEKHTCVQARTHTHTVTHTHTHTHAHRFGETVSIGRRDLRSGKQQAIAEKVDGGVRVRFE